MSLVDIHQLSVGYDRPLLHIPAARLDAGKLVALTGPNGSGKSTLLNTLIGRLPALSGTLQRPAAHATGYLQQQSEQDRDFPLSLFEWVLSGHWHRRGLFAAFTGKDRQQVEQWLRRFDLNSLSNNPLHQLSGGQWQRARLARLLVQQPSWLLLDEPFNNLDEHSQQLMVEALQAITQTGTAVLCVLHNQALVNRVFDDHWHILDGQLITQSTPADRSDSEALHA